MDLDPRTETQLKLLCDSRNRTIRELLEETPEGVALEELAERLVERDVTMIDADAYDQRVDRMSLELHHERLPRLSEAGLLEYDRETAFVRPRPAPASEVEWEEETDLEEAFAQLTSALDVEEGKLGVLHGFESAFRYARKLADEATDELFTIYATTDLLEEECVRYGEDALDRGVTLHIGSQNDRVRELCRTALPEATVWEPQLDWLNTPTYPRVGRLVLMDRRKVMCSVLETPPTKETEPTEVALVGSGTDSPLVVLVRELLGRRLDHLDRQDPEFRTGDSTISIDRTPSSERATRPSR